MDNLLKVISDLKAKNKLFIHDDLLNNDSIQNVLNLLISVSQKFEGIQIISHDLRYLFINEACINHAEQSPGLLIGRTMQDCYPGIEKTEVFSMLLATIGDKQIRSINNRFVYPSGNYRWFNLSIEPFLEGAIIRSVDITEKIELEGLFERSQRLESIGQLSSSLAHDFNNKLSVLSLNLDILIRESELVNKKSEEIVENMKLTISQASKLAKSMLSMGRKQKIEPTLSQINHVISQNLYNLSRIVGDSIKIIFTEDSSVGDILIDPFQLDQIVLNLCINSKDAMNEGGTISIETKRIINTTPYNIDGKILSSNNIILLKIKDTGTGISPKDISHIFTPYFSTKANDIGTGLGLFTVKSIVENAGGAIKVESTENYGTTFEIYFPESSSSLAKNLGPKTQQKNKNKNKTNIMLIEENEKLRQLTCEILNKNGYHVLVMNNLEQAYDHFQLSPTDIIICDSYIQGSRGISIAEKLIHSYPDLKIILLCGAINDPALTQNKYPVLEKPFSSDDLLMLIKK